MSITTFRAITTTLDIGAISAFVIAVASFLAMILKWRSNTRRLHVIRLLISIAAIPCLIGIHFGVLWLIYIPALGKESQAKYDAARAARLAESSYVQLGEPAPDFSLTTVDGEQFSLSGARGDTVLVNFFATWCGPCLSELPHIEKIWAEKRSDKHFRLVVIGREETVRSVREFREKNGFSFPIAADPDRSIFDRYARDGIPRTLVVSSEGLIAYSSLGFDQEDIKDLETVLRALVPPPVK